MKYIYSKTQSLAIGIMVLAMVTGGFLMSVRPAQAIPLPISIVNDAQGDIKAVGGGVAGAAFMSGMQYFINKIAYDTAVWLASGGKGQKPLMFDNPGKYFGDVAKDAAGEAIAGLNNFDFLKKAGINLCLPPDVNLSLRIKMDIANTIVNPPTPKCRWDDITKAYEQLGTPGYWSKIGIAFEPGQNDLSIYMKANDAVKEYSRKKELAARDDAAHKGETKVPEDSVTGRPTVSKEVAKTQAESGAPSEQAKKTEAQANSLTGSILSGTWGALILGANTFTNTIASQLMQKLTTRGFFSGLDGVCYLTDNQQKFCPQNGSSATAQGSFGGKTTAALAFADLLTPKIFTVNDYDGTLIAELGACDASHRGLYSCAADGGLLAALSQAKSGNALTVQQAVDQGYLHGNWQLLPPGNQADNQDPNCFTRAYCYPNLVKLRQVNVLPVGFELAATESNFKQPYTLDFFIKNFNNKDSIAYHLIDPNWLLKLPPTQCKARVFGQFLASEGTAERSEYCADLATCVNEDENGGCSSGQYGYCRQSKNIWRLGGDACPAQFNTCTAFVSRSGEAAGYIANTINKGVCDAQNVGCRAYSNTQEFSTAQDSWQWQGGKAQLAYFNKDAQSCSADAEGCTRFIRQAESVNGQNVNMRKAPDYYHCYDGHASSPQGPSGIFTGVEFSSSTLNWPANHADLVKLDTSLSAEEKQQCGRFARVCSAEENGCESYTPANGDPQVTGVLSVNDVCPQECVGYESFIQQSSFFEPLASASPKYFIPSTGNACNADNAGCDEFINIEKNGEQKSFFTELHLCSKDPADGATYYTWEGSDTTGYQLKSYVLKKDPAILSNVNGNVIGDGKGDAPAYLGSNLSGKLANYAERCNKTKYQNRLTDTSFDNDCREFYDKDGHISYRLWSQTVTVDPNACQKLRKSVSFGATPDERKTTCENTYGTWETTTNTCVYLAIPSEANTCEAQFNGCRAYKGNGGNNYQIIDTSTFEQAAVLPWSGGTLSTESTVQGGHSVKISKKTNEKVLERVFTKTAAQKGVTYLVSFWAKGTAGKELKAGLYQGATADGQNAKAENKITLSNNWSIYTAGPFTAGWDNDDITLAFKPSDKSADVFVDTITVRKMQDMVYVVRNSWNTPASCDNPINDPVGSSAGGTEENPVSTVPQAMLGCAAYSDRAGNSVTAKSFANICRAEAVGCEEVKDTANTTEEGKKYVNAVCGFKGLVYANGSTQGVNGSTKPFNNTNDSLPCKNAGGDVLCSISPGQDTCRFTRVMTEDLYAVPPIEGGKSDPINPAATDTNNKITFELFADSQTSIVSADRSVYVVNDSAYYCAEESLGCTAYGQRSWMATSTLQAGGGVQADYATTYIKNDSTQYDKISCQPEAEGCEQYSTGKGGQMYFKDPKVWGNFMCEWKDNVEYGAQTYNGWFRTGGVGFCGAKGASPAGLGNDKITQCVADSDCSKGQVCNQPLPCYPQYIVGGTTFGIYRAGDSGYNKVTNPVGQCAAQYDSCSEFVDPSDTSAANQNGKPYYVLDNAKLDKASCNGQASKEQGCVLFNKTSEVNYTPWTSQATYDASKNAGGALVKPVEVSGGGDANTILKVKRDRVCSEWLTCGSSQDVFDPNTAKTVKQCLAIQSCTKAVSTSVSGVGSVGNCGEYGKVQTADEAFNKNTVATMEKYQARPVGFSESDFTGFSIPLSYPVEFYKPVQFDEKSKNKTSLAFVYCPNDNSKDTEGKKIDGINCYPQPNRNPDFTICIEPGEPCGVKVGGNVAGVCDTNHRCALNKPLQNLGAHSVNVQSDLLCRGYPASDAPFSFKKASQTDQKNIRPLKYKDVNNCIDGQNCECSYNVALYGDTSKGEQKKGFFEQIKQAPDYICSGGIDKDGKTDDGGEPTGKCTKNSDGVNPPAGACFCKPEQTDCVLNGDSVIYCKGKGTILPKFKFDNQYVGWQDYCLEYDTSQVLYYKDGKPVYPCLTWYPVDKAPGAVDIYAQHKGAGYSLTGNAYYCAAGDQMLTKTPSGEKCGLPNPSGGGCDAEDWEACLKGAQCPEGYFAIVGTCETGGDCDAGYNPFGKDKCPYECIPNDAVFDVNKNFEDPKAELGGFLPDETITNSTEILNMVKSGSSCYEVAKALALALPSDNVKWFDNGVLNKFSVGSGSWQGDGDSKYVRNFMNDCLTYGVDASDTGGWYGTNFSCRALAQVSDASQDNTINKAWTDRLTNGKFTVPVMGYTKDSAPTPFGQAPEPTTTYPIMFRICKLPVINLGSNDPPPFILPDPITLACPEGYEASKELPQTRPYQFDYDKSFTNSCTTDSTAKESYYACLSGSLSSPTESGLNILSKKGQVYCTSSQNISKTNKECFDNLLNGIQCQKADDNSKKCQIKKGFEQNPPPGFVNGQSCTQPSQCTSSSKQTDQVKVECVDKFVCNAGNGKDNFRDGFWDNVLCDSSDSDSCKKYASKQLQTMCHSNGFYLACDGAKESTTETTDFSQGVARIQQLFAQVMNLLVWSQSSKKYEAKPWATGSVTKPDNAFELGKATEGGLPPQLHPVDGQKEGSEVDNAGQGFSVNGVYGVSGKPAYLLQESQLLATLSFYGFADKNHMPLRRIAIDWGDDSEIVGSGESPPVNYYKNKRKECKTSEGGAGGGWAGDPTACDSGEPFAYQHTYIFKEAQLDPSHCGQIGVLLGGAFTDFQKQFPNIAPNKLACVYIPKVQLLDNWGWCNASGTGGNAGCVDFKNGVFGCYDEQNSICFKGINKSNPISWTSFAGKVILLP